MERSEMIGCPQNKAARSNTAQGVNQHYLLDVLMLVDTTKENFTFMF